MPFNTTMATTIGLDKSRYGQQRATKAMRLTANPTNTHPNSKNAMSHNIESIHEPSRRRTHARHVHSTHRVCVCGSKWSHVCVSQANRGRVCDMSLLCNVTSPKELYFSFDIALMSY